tara:strand:- start:132 stop:518 length:387 start_codon:yes stop_codon:yes gene_type:complete
MHLMICSHLYHRRVVYLQRVTVIESGRAEPTKKLFEIGNLCGRTANRATFIHLWWTCEHSTKVIGIEFFDAQVHHGFGEIISNGGRAEPMKKAKRSVFFMAHVPLSLSQISLRVDVPRFELGASTMPR